MPEHDRHAGGLDERRARAVNLIASYREFVDETLLEVLGAALPDLEPAILSYYQAECASAMNCRRPTEDGRYAPSTEERILTTATAVVERVGARRSVE